MTKINLLGPSFIEQTPESFHIYVKDIRKFQNIKRPESAKPKLKKTRKKQTKNGKHDNNTRPVTSIDDSGKTQEDAINI